MKNKKLQLKRMLAIIAMVALVFIFLEMFDYLLFDIEYSLDYSWGWQSLVREMFLTFGSACSFFLLLDYVFDLSRKIEVEKDLATEDQMHYEKSIKEKKKTSKKSAAKKTKKAATKEVKEEIEEKVEEPVEEDDGLDADELQELLQKDYPEIAKARENKGQ